MNLSPSNRREFIKHTTTGALGLSLYGSVSRRILGANDRIRIGIIGCGNRGNGLIDQVSRFAQELNVEIVALCDVWRVNLERTRARLAELQGTKPKTFTRYADLLALEDVDAVAIATPDFAHTPILIDATKAGKDAYVEKPMACKMVFANQALKLVKKNDTVVQVGTQYRSSERHKEAAKVMHTGILGTISEVEAAYHRAEPSWARDYTNVREEDVDWEQYLMYLSDEPFSAERFRRWHLFKDFTIGTPGLLGAHRIDVATWLLDDPLPTTAVANGGVYVWKDGREHADTLDCVLEYPSGCMLNYSTRLGNSYPPTPNVIFYGTRGTFDTSSWTFRGEGGVPKKAITEPTTIPPLEQGNPIHDHVRNWLECIRSRETPNAPIEAGYAHSVAGIMCFKAWNTGQRMVYDKQTQEVKAG